jgi:acyl-CoA synthetase (AMP-forming)/AMP-acid ligase II
MSGLVLDLVAAAAGAHPDRLAVLAGDRRRTFAELDTAATRAASMMLAAGLRAGDRVALLADNELECIELHVACDRAGLVFVPLNHRCTVAELQYMVEHSSPSLLIAGPGYGDIAAQLSGRTWHLGTDGPGLPYNALVRRAHRRSFQVSLPSSAASVIQYTSGTTGRPKGAVISRGAVRARAELTVIELDVQPGDVLVQALPMFHIAAHLAYGFIVRGASVVFSGPFDPERLPRTLAEVEATHTLVVPTMINLMTSGGHLGQVALPHLRRLTYGGSPIPPEVLARAVEQLRAGYLQMFGMTETFFSSILRPHDHVLGGSRLASAGTDAHSMRTRVVDDDGGDVPTGQIGEVWARGPTLMNEYWNDSEATAAALSGGWMRTGDLAHRDDGGYLYVSGRLSDMVITGGENVYPREVEDVLTAHPAVLEVAVFGLPDQRWGERVHALVVTRPGATQDVVALEAFVRQRVAGYKVPRSWEFADSLPRNATGKVLKRDLRAQRLTESADGL